VFGVSLISTRYQGRVKILIRNAILDL
jgi:hypothetical protein